MAAFTTALLVGAAAAAVGAGASIQSATQAKKAAKTAAAAQFNPVADMHVLPMFGFARQGTGFISSVIKDLS